MFKLYANKPLRGKMQIRLNHSFMASLGKLGILFL